MSLPKISIVTPVFNGVNFLEETILSVLNQNYANLEYIIIDGGSTDGSIDIIKKYEHQLTYWISENDRGMYDAIQKGFSQSTGEIMGWINSDDLYSPYCLSIISNLLENNSQICWLTGLNVTYDEKSRIIGAHSPRKITRLDMLSFDYSWIQQESTFWRRSLWEKAGAKLSNYTLAGDFELWLRFSRYQPLYYINTYLGGFRSRSHGQLSLDYFDEYNAECKKIIKKEPVNKSELPVEALSK